jgi:hypothetical protein
MVALMEGVDKMILVQWAIDCAERVLPYFEEKYPHDKRPRIAIDTLKEWMKTGVFKMAVIRKASLDSHAAAKEIGNDSAAASAAHASGQAVATAHVWTHAIGPAIYAQQAIHRANEAENADLAVRNELKWQIDL